MAKDSKRNRKKLEVPDGYADPSEIQEFLARRDGEKKEEKVISLDSRRPIAAGAVHSGPEIPKPGSGKDAPGVEPGEPKFSGSPDENMKSRKEEIKEPKYFFEKNWLMP